MVNYKKTTNKILKLTKTIISYFRQSSRASEAELWFKRALQLAPLEASVHHQYGKLTSYGWQAGMAIKKLLRCAAANRKTERKMKN